MDRSKVLTVISGSRGSDSGIEGVKDAFFRKDRESSITRCQFIGRRV